MPIGGLIAGAGSLASGLITSSAASNAADKGLAAQQAMFGQGAAANQPFINAGQGAAETLRNLLTPGANQTATLNQLPGYQFAQDWGQKAVQNIGSTQGFGGNTLTAGANFATGLAGQQFGSLASLLQGLTNTGASSAQSLLGGAVQSGNAQSNTIQSGVLGSANALAGGLQGATGAGANALLINKLFGGGAGATSYGPGGIYGSGDAGRINAGLQPGVSNGGYNFLDAMA